jgi:hypothetical protein
MLFFFSNSGTATVVAPSLLLVLDRNDYNAVRALHQQQQLRVSWLCCLLILLELQ